MSHGERAKRTRRRGGGTGKKASREDNRRRRRIKTVAVILAVAFAIVSGRLVQVHLFPAPQLELENGVHEGRIIIPVPRGRILDRNGVVLATDDKVPSLWADPSAVQEPERVALLLSARAGLDEEEVLQLLSKRTDSGNARKFVYLKRWITDVPAEELEKIVEEAGKGLYLIFEPMRFYPQNELAAHLLGFVNRAGEPCEGVELFFDNWLHGVPGERIARKDAKSNLLTSMTLEYTPPKDGDHVFLTLDAAIQQSLEKAIDENLIRCNAPSGMGMILDVHTGAILALACRPAYDPNHYEDYSEEQRRNRTLVDAFEPGSVFKIVVASAVLEHELITTETIIDCESGAFNPYGHRIRDIHRMGAVPFAECFAESSNVAHVKIGALLGPERLEHWIRRFGFGERCTRELKRVEGAGIFRARSEWSRLTMGALPIGQEISVTMPQLARAFAAIANGGFLVEPHILERVEDREGATVFIGDTRPTKRILSPQTAQTMRELCHQVVMHGTGTTASIPEYRVGGKTGTAQIAKKGGGGYEKDKVTAIFAGFAPVGEPRLACVIIVNEPMIERHFGGFVCGPVFQKVMREALVRLHVPEDPVAMEADVKLAANADADTAASRAEEAGEDEEEPFVLEPFDDLELVMREQDGTEWVRGLPDFAGMTKRQAHEQLAELGIPWDAQGAGRVVRQHPNPGTPVTQVDICRLTFASRPLEVQDEQATTM